MDLRKSKIIATLVYPIMEGKVLLGKKARKIGVGSWNGLGGAVEKGETIRQAALRELMDESDLYANLEDLEYVGKVTFHNERADGRKFDVEVHLFLLKEWSGVANPSKSEMIEPTFWPIESLPYHEMMASDKDWLPFVLRSEWIEAEVWYILNQNTMTKPTKIEKVSKLGDID